MERIDLDRERHTVRQWWHNGDVWDTRTVVVSVGELADGRWFVRLYGGGFDDGARAYAGPNAEHYARGTARRWMRTVGGTWAEA
jgi:hypothetical protein